VHPLSVAGDTAYYGPTDGWNREGVWGQFQRCQRPTSEASVEGPPADLEPWAGGQQKLLVAA